MTYLITIALFSAVSLVAGIVLGLLCNKWNFEDVERDLFICLDEAEKLREVIFQMRGQWKADGVEPLSVNDLSAAQPSSVQSGECA